MSLIRDFALKDIEENGDTLAIIRGGMTDDELRDSRKMVMAGEVQAPTVREIGMGLIGILDNLKDITRDMK